MIRGTLIGGLFSFRVHVTLEILCLSSWERSQVVGHVVELCPQTNLMVGVYLAAVLFFSLNNYKAFF